MIDVLRVSKVTFVNLQVEVAHGLLHGGVAEGSFLGVVELVCGLGDSEGKRFIAESQVLGGNMTIEENVDTFPNTVRKRHNTVHRRLAVKNTDVIREVVQNTKIVLDN